jgi:hypothetical protein
VDSVDLVKLAFLQRDPFRLVLVLVIGVRRVNVVSPAASPPPNGNCDWVESYSHAVRAARVQAELTGVVARYKEAILSCCWSLEVAIPDLTEFVSIVESLFKDKLVFLVFQWPCWST